MRCDAIRRDATWRDAMLPGADGVCVGVGDNFSAGFQREVPSVQGGTDVDKVGQKLPSANGVKKSSITTYMQHLHGEGRRTRHPPLPACPRAVQ